MGTTLSHRFSLCQRKSRVSRQQSEKDIFKINNNNNNNFSFSNDNHALYFIRELIPERYLVLLTEQMTEMLFCLMIFNDTSLITIENISDYRTTLRYSINSDDLSSPILPTSSKTVSSRSSSQLQSIHQPCRKCQMKMLTIEEFRELHNAFYRVDNDHDNYLTKDEIRTTLNYLFELTENDIKEIISVFDTNKDDRISLEEYIEEMKHRLLHEFTRDEIKFAFDQADIDKTGHLRAEELKNAIGYLNFHLPNRRIIEIVNDCVQNLPTDSVDIVFFTNIVEALHCREPITLQKFKTIHHDIHIT